MALMHVVRPGETLLAIAEIYGFRAWQTIAEAPENAALIQRRGNPHALIEDDELQIPDCQIGECAVPSRPAQSAGALDLEGAPTLHKMVLRTHAPLLELRVYCEFRRVLEDEDAPVVVAGAKNHTKAGWVRGKTVPPLAVKNAAVAIGPGEGRQGPTDKTGILRVTALTDGVWTMRLDPDPDELSPGPALPDDGRDHGFDWNKGNVARGAARPKKGFEVEYRPLDLTIEVKADAIAAVTITSDKRDDRPDHALCFWHDGTAAGPAGVTQVLEIDLKADFLRKLDSGGGVHPPIRERDAKPGLRLFEIHHTTGNQIGSTLNKFINKRSGVHFINDRDGHVVRMVDDRYAVTHGGGERGKVENAWADATKINDQAIGVENVQGKKFEFTVPQIDALIGLVRRARQLYSAIEINHVVGHCDVYTGKFDCPGPLFPWEKLEEAGVALGPRAISDEAMELEWGGFFAGEKGKKRALKEGDADRKDADGTFAVVRNAKVVASGLTLAPVALLNEALHRIGYTPNRAGKKVASFETWRTKHLGTVGAGTRVALMFFRAHYSQGERKSPSKFPVLDVQLARLVLGCYRSLGP